MTATKTIRFETRDGEYTIEGETFKECRIRAGRFLSVSGPRALHFYEVGGNREFYTSLYDGQDYHTDAAGRQHGPN